MEDMTTFLKRAAERCGMAREHYIERNIPTHQQNVMAFQFFGDTRSEFVLSSLLLKRYKEELKGSKYLIMIGWKGHKGLFPYVDEYWSPADNDATQKLLREANGFSNNSTVFTVQQQNLNWFFNTSTFEDIKVYYDNGLTKEFFDRFKTVRYTMPMVPSSSILDYKFNTELLSKPGFKVLLMPSKYVKSWRQGRCIQQKANRDFWLKLVTRLLSEGFTPVVLQNYGTYDLSTDLAGEAIFLKEDDISKSLGAMRATGCVLDVFNNTSRLAIAARTPYVAVDERPRYMEMKDYELDDLCGSTIPRQYIFAFSTILDSGDPNSWNASIFDNIIVRLKAFLPTVDRNNLPSTAESTVDVPYSCVKERKVRRIGAKFVKIPRD
jgi:hypothetical protein